ncbi:fibronectin type III domain-containing protein, partial [Flavobacterium rhizosphaerae]
MKKITLLLFFMAFTFQMSAQLAEENFEGTWTPYPALAGFGEGSYGPPGWYIRNVAPNGPGKFWTQQASTSDYPAYGGSGHAAFLDRDNAPGTGVNLTEDWLITPQFNVPENPELHFFSRLTLNNNQGSVYDVRIGTDPTDPSTFISLIDSDGWTELEINPVQLDYVEKVIDIPASFEGTDVYIAFIMKGDQMDRWLIDNVKVVSECLAPTESSLTATNLGATTADLSWDNPSGATSWEVEVVADDDVPVGTGVVYTGTLPITVENLTASTCYKFYVRAVCGDGGTSDWIGPENFCTGVCEAEDQCTYSFVVWDSFGDGWNGNTMTVSQNGITMGTLTLPSGAGPNTISIALCDDQPLQLFWNSGGNFASEVGVSIINNYGQTIFTKNPGTGSQNTSLYSATIDCDTPLCLPTSGLTATGITTYTANLGWTGPATGNWEYYVVPTGAPAPTAITAGVVTTTNPVTATTVTTTGEDLDPDTTYQFYVRLICTDGTSTWAGPFSFTTLPTCPKPINITTTAIGMETVTIGWTETGTATQWEVYVVTNGSPAPTATTEGVVTTDNPLEYNTGLTAGTIYQVYVKAICTEDTDESQWSAPVTFNTTICNPEEQCNWTFTVWDSWGDGWNGNTMTVSQNGISVGTLTLPSGTGPVNITIPLCNDTPVELFWNSGGSFAGEVGVSVKNSFDQTLFTKNPGTGSQNTLLYTTTVDCDTPACLDPTALAAANIGTTTADLSWTGPLGATDWEVYIVETGGDAPTDTTEGDAAPAIPYNADELTPDTTYQFWVRANCASGNISGWAGPVSFTTLPTCPKPVNITVTAIGATQATIGWTESGTATQWEVIVVPTGSPAPTASSTGVVTSENPMIYDVDLVSGTIYQVYVRALCGGDDGNSTWTGPVTFNTTLCELEDQCNWVFTVWDSWGDGWNGNTMTVSQNGITVGTLTLPSGAGPVNITIPVCNDTPIQLFWNSGGSFANEVGVSVMNNFGQVLFTKNPGTGSQNTVLYTTTVDCDTPACLPPSGLTVIDTNTTDATVGWAGEDTGEWEVYYTTSGNAAPGADETEVIFTTTNPVVIENLEPSTLYDFYVRVVCEDEDHSTWAGPFTFETDPLCPEPLNVEIHCLNEDSATFTWVPDGSETSWEVAVIPASDPVPTTGEVVTDTHYYVEDLTTGTAYTFYVRAICSDIEGFSSWAEMDFTPPSVSPAAAQALCAGNLAVPQESNWGNTVPGYGQVGCLFSTPNPTWYYVTLDGDGEVVLNLTQVNLAGNPIDVDFAAFGPFESLQEACYSVGLPPNTDYIVDCSYSAAATETINVTGEAGDVFAILVTNFNGSQGSATITQTSGPDISCEPTVNVGPDLTFCQTDSYNITATVSNPGEEQEYTYQWFMDADPITPVIVETTDDSQTITVDEPGAHVYSVIVTMPIPVSDDPITDQATITLSPAFTVPTPDPITLCGPNGAADLDLSAVDFLGTLDPDNYELTGVYDSFSGATGGTNPIDISAPFEVSTQTLYVVVNDINVPGCKQIVQLAVTVNTAPDATISYNTPFCITGTPESVTLTGDTGGTYSSTDGLALDPSTGEITPDQSIAGTYTVTYTIPASECDEFTTTTEVVIQPVPQVTFSYDGSPYCANAGTASATFTGTTGGTFTADADVTIDVNTGDIDVANSVPGTYTVTYTVGNGACTGTYTADITIIEAPVPDVVSDVTECDSYSLPALTVGNYYTGSAATGDALSAGDIITSTQMIYIYAQSAENAD